MHSESPSSPTYVQPPLTPVKQQTYTEEDIRLQKRRTRLGSRQFPRGDLLLLDYLGDGEYGPIYRGEAYNLGIKEKSRPVTVKMLATQAPEATRIRFEQDIALLSSFNHLNVVGMLAVCTEDSPECILLDAGKDMLSVIRERKVIMEQEAREGVPIKSLAQETVELLKIADEVCIGMAYLASQRFVHKDLALRNCIVGYDGVTKVASFGLGPAFYPEAYHRVLQGRELPIRWMAPEAISSGQFTITNDIWAFGVLMWEILTYGELPYPDKSNENVINFVAKDFGKLTRPENCLEDVYLVMSSCWELEPQSRPTFITLHENIFDVQGEIEQQIQ